MTTPKNDRFLRALRLEPVDQTPVWVMRQAGRYLPEYRELRAQVPDFMSFCRNTEFAAEATIQPLARFPLDAAIVFSDILTVPDAMGCRVHFESGKGPIFADPIRNADEVNKLCIPDVADSLGYVADAISLARKKIANQVPLIGFAGSPWTVGCYMVEGSGSKQFLLAKKMLYKNPELMHKLLQKITETTIHYLTMQVEAGAQALMIFDSWGGLLCPATYAEFSLKYMQNIVTALKSSEKTKDIPVILFSKHAHHAYAALAASGCQGIGVDWSIELKTVREQIQNNPVALQGNLDPALLLSDPIAIQAGVRRVLESYGKGPGHIFNLGHGIDKTTPIENMTALVQAVQTYSREKS
jgi:uroporphyrinogen decarboxylase